MAGEIAQEWETLGDDDDAKRAELISEAHVIIPYHMQHNAEAEACDLLMEMEQLELLTSQDYVDKVGRIVKDFLKSNEILVYWYWLEKLQTMIEV